MANDYFEFKQFLINQQGNVFRVGTDGVLLGAWAGSDSPGIKKILDVGTGTGLIALMLAQRFSGASVTAIEPDRVSFETASSNVAASKWSASVEMVNSSLQAFASNCSVKFDLVVSNPPFFSGSLKNPNRKKASFRHSDQGELTTAVLLKHASSLISEGGLLGVILPWAEGNVMVAEAVAKGLYCSRMLKIRPFLHSPFNRVLLEFRRERSTSSVKILTMGHPLKGGYSRDYIGLTKEFYLNF